MNTRPKYDPAKKQDSALEVTRAQAEGHALVALESVMMTHGLTRPNNLVFAQDMEQAVRDENAVPATVGVLEGKLMVGMSQVDLERLAYADAPLKLSPRNFAAALLQKSSGGTTLAGTMFAANQRGIKVLATGGIGGVQVEQRFDVSPDLKALAEIPMLVVCSGALTVLDIAATAEYLETISVPVVGYQTDKFPEFLLQGKNIPVSVRLDTPEEIAKFARLHWKLGLTSAVLVCQPVSAALAMDRKQAEEAISKASQEAQAQAIRGQRLTPFLLKRVNDLTGGKSMRINQALALNNARLAAQISRILVDLERIQNIA